MKRRFKFKINGDSPRSIFIALVLAKLNCDVFIYDFLKNSNSKTDYQIFLFSKTAKYLLSKFDIWKEIEKISYGFTSLSIKDNLFSEEILLKTRNFSKNCLDTIGWTARYSDIKNLLINKLINSDNVYFISKNQLLNESLIFDFEFDFKNYDKISNSFKLPFSRFKQKNKEILIFNVYLRGHVEKRFYEINTNEGLIVLTPLNKNYYQIIWKNPSFRIRQSSLRSKSFFLDNLTSLLPDELKIDQINGDINSLHVRHIYSTYLIKNKSIYFNENMFKSNPIYDFNFDVIIKNILLIYNFLENNEHRRINILYKSPFFYLLRKYIEIKLNLSFSNSLFNLFTENNIFLLLLRKSLFTLIKRISLVRNLFMKGFYNSSINNLIK